MRWEKSLVEFLSSRDNSSAVSTNVKLWSFWVFDPLNFPIDPICSGTAVILTVLEIRGDWLIWDLILVLPNSSITLVLVIDVSNLSSTTLRLFYKK